MELYFLALLILLMAGALASGYPVAFSLPGSAILTIGIAAACGYLFAGDTSAFFAHGGPSQWLSAGVTNFRGVYWEADRDTLIAIPLFVFMGIMLQRSKIAEDLLVTMAQLFGPMPGGLGISVIFVGALLAATTGIVGATVVAMGLISLPAMMRNKYSNSLASGTIAASGTLGQIIPPSIVLIILADQLSSAVDQASTARKELYKTATGEFSMPSTFDVGSTSAGEMFLGAFIPGLVLVGIYIVYLLVLALLRPKMAPAVHREGKFDAAFVVRLFLALVPPLALIFVVLGSIILGVATVNQAGAIGAVGATVMAGYRLRDGQRGAFWPGILAIVSLVAIFIVNSVYHINVKNIRTPEDETGLILGIVAVAVFLFAVLWSGWRTLVIGNTLRGVMVETAKTSSMVFIILLGAAMLTAAFRSFGGEELVKEFLTGLPGGFWMQFVIVMAVIFFLGFFLDFIEIAVVVVPIVAPILLMDPQANVTAVWLGVMVGLNIQTSFLTPPFGFALFYLRGVAPAIVKTVEIYKGVVPFIALQLLALVIAGLYPPLVNYLPNRVSLLSDTAPPPVNPRLQYCIEEYVFQQFTVRGDAITRAIAEARAIDISALPEDLREDLTEAFDNAEKVQPQLQEIRAAAASVDAAEAEYMPLHDRVRGLQRDMARVDARVADLDQRIQRRRREGEDVSDLERQAEDLRAEKAVLQAAVPADWDERHKAFAALLAVEEKARAAYRRLVDDAYEPIKETIQTLDGTAALAAVGPAIDELDSAIASMTPEAAGERVSAVSSQLSGIEGTSDIRSALSKVRRALTGRTPDPQAARTELEAAKAAWSQDVAWRQQAVTTVQPGLVAYEATIRNTIGMRQQPRVPEEIVPEIASCLAVHRNISLNF